MKKKYVYEEEKQNLAQIFSIQKGTTLFIGGGGKTTTLLRIGRDLEKLGADQIILTTTTHMLLPDGIEWISSRSEWDHWVRQPPASRSRKILLAKAERSWEENGKNYVKVTQADFVSFDEVRIQAEYILIEADGSRQLPLKVHDFSYEPAWPPHWDRCIALAGLSALGKKSQEQIQRIQLWNSEDLKESIDADIFGRILRRYPRVDDWVLNQYDAHMLKDTALAQREVEQIAQMLPGTVWVASVQRDRAIYEKWEDEK